MNRAFAAAGGCIATRFGLLSPNDSNATTGFENTPEIYPDTGLLKTLCTGMVVDASGPRLTGLVITTPLSSRRSVSVPVTVAEFGFINCNCAPSFTTGKKALKMARDRNGTASLAPVPDATAAASRSGLVLWMRMVVIPLVAPNKLDTVFTFD